MAYDNGANTWPAGATDIGKTYGPRFTGDVNGKTKTEGNSEELVFEFNADTSSQPYVVEILGDYIIEELTLNVEEAFAATSTADIDIDGGAGLTTDLDLVTTGVSHPSTAGLGNSSGSGPVDLTLTLDAAAKASATGKASLAVRYTRAH